MNERKRNIEIEQKFLVVSDEWKSNAEGVFFKQGYLSIEPERVVRVRVEGNKGKLTVKGKNHNLVTPEFEYDIPLNDALFLLDNICYKPLIEKTRYKIYFENILWEVDEFHGLNEGLTIAEVELSYVGEQFAKPIWIGKNVTDDPKYKNSNLVQNPFSMWGKQL